MAAAFVILVTTAAGATASASPSWCNATGLNASEAAICSSPILGALDQRLNEAYAAAREVRSDLDQMAWLNDRNACGWDFQCIERSYRGRIATLRTIALTPDVASPSQGRGTQMRHITTAPIPDPGGREASRTEGENRPWTAAGRDRVPAPVATEALGIDPAAAALPVLNEMTPRPWCGAASLNPTEQTVCGNRDLSRLDALLELVYGRATARNEDRVQLQWLRSERDGCGTDVFCIALAYADRIEALNAPFARDAARRHDVEIPAGHFPPPGLCRLWYPERPPGQQPPPSSCDVSVPAGAVFIRG